MKNAQAAPRTANGDRNTEQGTRRPEPTYRKSTAREYFESICVAVILALFVRTFIVQAFKIPTGSMENNLLIGDHLLVNKFVFAPTLTAAENTLLPIDPIARGNIIVFQYPEEPERDFIKRVIGLPGETIELRNKKVYIDNRPLDEPYVHFLFPPDEGERGEADANDFDVRRQYRAGHRPRRPLLHDGRQPRQFPGQPLLGLPAARGTSRARRCSCTSRSARSPASSPACAGTGSSTRFIEDDHQAPHHPGYPQRRRARRHGRVDVLPVQGHDRAAGDFRRALDAGGDPQPDRQDRRRNCRCPSRPKT